MHLARRGYVLVLLTAVLAVVGHLVRRPAASLVVAMPAAAAAARTHGRGALVRNAPPARDSPPRRGRSSGGRSRPPSCSPTATRRPLTLEYAPVMPPGFEPHAARAAHRCAAAGHSARCRHAAAGAARPAALAGVAGAAARAARACLVVRHPAPARAACWSRPMRCAGPSRTRGLAGRRAGAARRGRGRRAAPAARLRARRPARAHRLEGDGARAARSSRASTARTSTSTCWWRSTPGA